MKNTSLLCILFSSFSVYAEPMMDSIRGEAALNGYVVATPCSIETESQYQYIYYDISNTEVDSLGISKVSRRPFNIKLNNCISEYENNKHKGISIQFYTIQDTFSDAITLSGPTPGIVLYIYDINDNILAPNKSHSITENTIYFDKKTKKSILKYETEINTTDKNIEPGDYSALIKFNISYD